MAGDAPSSPSYAVRQAAAKYPVVLYTAAHCTEPCQQARSLLNGRGVPFAERMLARPDIEDFSKRFGKRRNPLAQRRPADRLRA